METIPKNVKDLTGKKFEKLIVVSFSHIKNRLAYWNVICECGVCKKVRGNLLTYGNTKSCGCYNRSKYSKAIYRHGLTGTRIWNIWHYMKNRGTNPNFPKYENIGIDKKWLVFENFYKDMAQSYFEHVELNGEKYTTIDRINNNLGYCKENCRWATYAVQNRNLSDNHRITYRGETKCLVDWAKEVGIRFNTIIGRLNRGWSTENALTIPADRHNKLLKLCNR